MENNKSFTENDSTIFMINVRGTSFVKKWEKDSKQGMYLYGPAGTLISVTLFAMIVGFSFKLILILILPLSAVFTASYYVPLGPRKRLINNTVKKIEINGSRINITTCDYLFFKSKSIQSPIKNIIVTETTAHDFFKNEIVFQLKKDHCEDIFYIIIGFFEDSNRIVEYLERKSV
ncbi:hypothetical protein [Mucilaginibacter gilvus]|uniref:Uncharacterized protein n=1 Tax=Mucilaginibacter gilvus TaxID=2305909 RepID=A0A444MKP7_9SPHI|nr:hypothetical protein [Mucilaginibacter gilvus]RWY49425.1 hypothetical protein EPL05_18650 [Mucilaginibacter gilvus]